MSGGALVVLVVMNDFGTSLLFFGVVPRDGLRRDGPRRLRGRRRRRFAVGSLLANAIAPQVGRAARRLARPLGGTAGRRLPDRAIAVLHRRRRGLRRRHRSGYIAHRDGSSVIPAVQTDFIYSAIAAELGLAGAAGVLLLYLLLTWRGLKIAAVAGDGFSKLLATGITFAFALPGHPDRRRGRAARAAHRHHAAVRELRRLVDAGELVGLALLLAVSAPRHARGSAGVNPQIAKLFVVLATLLVALSR